jgi:Tfp pilus assembly protein PilF
VKIGPYEVREEIGRGGMGVVLRGDAPDGSTVALKVLPSMSDSARATFSREASVLKKLGRDDGFVSLVDVVDDGKVACLVMPFVPGGTLRARLKRGPLSPAAAVSITLPLARSLGRAHALGLVHRDVKPENVLFDAAGRPLLADLGLAKHFGAAPGTSIGSFTRTGAFRGTAGYMPLEQMLDARNVDPRADVFALGCILYECLAGAPAFPGESVVEILGKIERGTYTPLPATVPGGLVAVVKRALARDPAGRPRDGNVLARDLEDALLVPERSPWRAVAALLGVVVLVLAGALVAVLATTARSTTVPGKTPPPPASPPRTPPPPPPVSPPDPELAPDAAHDRAHELAMEAHRLVTTTDYAGARRLADSALELAPRCARVHAARGEACLLGGDPATALEEGDVTITLAPEQSVGWVIRAEARRLLGQFEASVADATRALELKPDAEDALRTRGRALLDLKDNVRAMADADRALAIDPGDVHCYDLRGAARLALGEFAGAEADFTRALELKPEARRWLNRAAERAQRNDLDAALGDYKRALSLGGLKPDDEANARMVIEWIHTQKGKERP